MYDAAVAARPPPEEGQQGHIPRLAFHAGVGLAAATTSASQRTTTAGATSDWPVNDSSALHVQSAAAFAAQLWPAGRQQAQELVGVDLAIKGGDSGNPGESSRGHGGGGSGNRGFSFDGVRRRNALQPMGGSGSRIEVGRGGEGGGRGGGRDRGGNSRDSGGSGRFEGTSGDRVVRKTGTDAAGINDASTVGDSKRPKRKGAAASRWSAATGEASHWTADASSARHSQSPEANGYEDRHERSTTLAAMIEALVGGTDARPPLVDVVRVACEVIPSTPQPYPLPLTP